MAAARRRPALKAGAPAPERALLLPSSRHYGGDAKEGTSVQEESGHTPRLSHAIISGTETDTPGDSVASSSFTVRCFSNFGE